MAGEPSPAALKEAIHVARARAGITSDMQISVRSGVAYDTLMNWYRGTTVPRPAQLLKVARVLNVSLESLLGPYEGREPAPSSFEAALQRHSDMLDRQNELLERIVAALSGGAIGLAQALAPGPDRGLREVSAATALALQASEEEAGGVRPTDPVPGGRRGRR